MADPIIPTPTDRPETVVSLSTPLSTHKGPVNELILRGVPGSTFLKHGGPIKTVKEKTDEGERETTDYNWKAVFHFASAASGVDEILLMQIGAEDMMKLAVGVTVLLYPTRKPIIAA